MIAPAPGCHPLPVAWGGRVLADPTKTIGRCIWTTGVFDLAVSEVLARLVQPGDLVIDGGANVGYMTLLAAAAVGNSGTVLAFEPNPDMYSILTRNVESSGNVLPYNVALGESRGRARLALPAELSSNDGVAYIARGDFDNERTVEVGMETIDAALGARRASFLKLDVEGYELPVLKGAADALGSGRIRNVLYEDHEGAGSAVSEYLRTQGYRTYSIGWTVAGLALEPARSARLANDYEAPSYLATLDPDDALRRCGGRGWLTLRPNLGRGVTVRNARASVPVSDHS